MEPITLVIICAASLGLAASAVTAIHHVLLTRNARLNQLAREKAIVYQQDALKKLREELKEQEFTAHHDLISENKESILRLDSAINALIEEKGALIEQQSKLLQEQVEANTGESQEGIANHKKEQMLMKIEQLDEKLDYLQKQRGSLWKHEKKLEAELMKTEASRNARLNFLYKQHSELLEKLQLAQDKSLSSNTEKNAEVTASLFEKIILAPVNAIVSFFTASVNVDYQFAIKERRLRAEVKLMEEELAEPQGVPKLEAGVSASM